MRTALVCLLLAVVPATASAGRWHRPHGGAPSPIGGGAATPDPGTFGSIAYSAGTGQVGYSWGQPDGETAKQAAINACGYADCAWQVFEQNEYATIAVGDGGIVGVAWNPDTNAAQAAAMQVCESQGTGCSIRAWVFK